MLCDISADKVHATAAACVGFERCFAGGLTLEVGIPELHTQVSASGTDEFTLFDMIVRVDLGAPPIAGLTQEYTHTTMVRRYSQFRDFHDVLKKGPQTSAAYKVTHEAVNC